MEDLRRYKVVFARKHDEFMIILFKVVMVVGGSDWRARLALMEKIQTRHEAEMQMGFFGNKS